MRKMLFAFAATAAIVLVTGCAGVKTADTASMNGQELTVAKTTPVAHINGQNCGFYLLSIPIFSGSTEKPGDMLFGKDTVKLENVVNMVTLKSKELGATHSVDMQSHVSSMMIPLPFPFLFYLKEVEVSANAVK